MVWPFSSVNPTPSAQLPPNLPPLELGSKEGELLSKKDQEKAQSLATQYRFDSAALERAAKAAKDLERSPHAKELLELTKSQEVTRQLELQKNNNEFSANLERLRHEEQRKTIEQQAQLAKQKAQYEDQLARKRYHDQLEEQKYAQEEKLRREAAHQEELARRQREAIIEQEEIRRRNIDYEIKRKAEEDMKRIAAEFKGRASYERENYDIHKDRAKLDAEEKRTTNLQMVAKIGDVVGQGFKEFINDRTMLRNTVLGITLTVGGIYTAKYSVRTVAKNIESRIGRPTLLRETSRLNAIDLFTHPIKTIQRIKASRSPEDALKDVILKPTLEQELRDVAIATKNKKLNKSCYTNLMFYGPPGTGKTLIARKLAQHSGMDYAIMSGGDVGPLGKDAVTAIHKVFDWSKTSRRGLMLFIDEAEGFLSDRRTGKLSVEDKRVLDAFLQQTGTQSNKFMLVLSTNIPEQFDKSILDRIDLMIKFENPTFDERRRLMTLYFEKFVLEPASRGGKRALKVDNFDYVKVCDDIARMTEGFSGRAIAKLGVALQDSAFAQADRKLTEALVMKCLQRAIEDHKERQKLDTVA